MKTTPNKWKLVINQYATQISNDSESITILSVKWKQFVKLVISSFVNRNKIVQDGIMIEPTNKCLKITGFDSKHINIAYDEFKEWIKAFIRAMENFYETPDSILG